MYLPQSGTPKENLVQAFEHHAGLQPQEDDDNSSEQMSSACSQLACTTQRGRPSNTRSLQDAAMATGQQMLAPLIGGKLGSSSAHTSPAKRVKGVEILVLEGTVQMRAQDRPPARRQDASNAAQSSDDEPADHRDEELNTPHEGVPDWGGAAAELSE